MKSKLIKTSTILILLAVLATTNFLPNLSLAQNSNEDNIYMPIEFGAEIPEDLWNLDFSVLNDSRGVETIKLADYKGKLILLDFWATYCSSCILNFPKLREIQEKYPDELKLLAVTIQNKSEIEKFFNSNLGREYNYLSTIVDGDMFKNFFPHNGIPHVVWILPDGKYLAATGAEDVTAANIQSTLADQEAKFRIKIDLDRSKPLFISDDFYLNEGMKVEFSSFFSKGQYPGYPSGHKIKLNAEKKVFGRQMTNISLFEILRTLADHLFEQKGIKFTDKQFLMQSKNPMLVNGGNYKEDNYSDLYCYELIVPYNVSDSLYSYMLQDLNRYLDFQLSMEEVETDCYSLIRTSSVDNIKTRGGKSEQNYNEKDKQLTIVNGSLESFVSILNELPISDKIIIDETGYNGRIDLKVDGMNSLDALRMELRNLDLDLIALKRNMLLFVVKDK
ncbi:MAG: hypothetical protein BGO31_12910 [Bacteroidetes bacterium 43-16]|nr:MAG: hypothetical protein BGO31_12910 [Bacteroidetes bacterium 43-16]